MSARPPPGHYYLSLMVLLDRGGRVALMETHPEPHLGVPLVLLTAGDDIEYGAAKLTQAEARGLAEALLKFAGEDPG